MYFFCRNSSTFSAYKTRLTLTDFWRKTLCVGIDGTDHEINNGIYGQTPEGANFLVIGHETLARVANLGRNVKDFSVGDLVVPTVRRPSRKLRKLQKG